MATPTKTYVEKIVTNQNKLFQTLSRCANEMVDTWVPAPVQSETAGKLAQAFYQHPAELMEEMTQPETIEKFQNDFWGNSQALAARNMKHYMDLYQQSVQYMQQWMSTDGMGQQQEKLKKTNDIMQTCMKACMETTTENARVVQEYFN